MKGGSNLPDVNTANRAALAMLLTIGAGCQQVIPAGSETIPTQCINVPERHCPEVFLFLAEMGLTRAQVDRAVVTCIGRCTDTGGRADVVIFLTNGDRVPFGETRWGSSAP